jgi:hypothetical protein
MPVEILQHLLTTENIKKYAILISVLLTLGGAVSSVLANKLNDLILQLFKRLVGVATGESQRTRHEYSTRLTKPGGVSPTGAPVAQVTPVQVARERAVKRLEDASEAMDSQRTASTIARWSSHSLTVAQYVIGGVLASSFIQESLSPKLVGGMGVLVLIASLFKQQFHPEINAEFARKKASQLQGFIRMSEDQLTILDAKIAAGQDHTDAMIGLLTQITKRLTEIENPEAFETRPA